MIYYGCTEYKEVKYKYCELRFIMVAQNVKKQNINIVYCDLSWLHRMYKEAKYKYCEL